MNDRFNQDPITRGSSYASEVDQGLRAHMLRVYNYMGMALGVTALVSYGVSLSPALMSVLFGSPLAFVVLLAPLVMVFVLVGRLHKMSVQSAQISFWSYSALMGLSLAPIFMAYTGHSVAKTFLICSATFGAMSIYGYTTKKDLTAMGSFLRMGLFGLIIAMVVNIFVASAMMDFLISAIGVVIFTGLTAYDTQMIKASYYEGDHSVIAEKKAIFGALRLYLDFVNLFLMLLRFFGDRR